MNNIYFKIGQPNTGKSHGFKKEQLQKNAIFMGQDIEYKVIPVSGGVGNEYKGLQNTDLALSYDPINKTLRFGEFLQMLMSAIVQPEISHIVFLDDFHNQDISSLLSEYTPLFKSQQKANLSSHKKLIADEKVDFGLLKKEEFETADKFIIQWNGLIKKIKKADTNIISIPITNRISGSSLDLIFPANFYLVGAANFNEKTLNIFADWADRAEIEIIDPIDMQEKVFDKNGEEEFITCCKTLNTNLRDMLHEQKIFDYKKYCFGIWKVVDEKGRIVTGNNQKKVVEFFFSMIKNSLIYNNKNSEINAIGFGLIKSMKEDPWFQTNMLSEQDMKNLEKLDIDNDDENGAIFEILHSFNIYDN